MEFDVYLSFLFVNSFKLSRKRFQYGKRFFSCLERFKVKFIDHVKLKIIFVLGFSQKYLNLLAYFTSLQ